MYTNGQAHMHMHNSHMHTYTACTHTLMYLFFWSLGPGLSPTQRELQATYVGQKASLGLQAQKGDHSGDGRMVWLGVLVDTLDAKQDSLPFQGKHA